MLIHLNCSLILGNLISNEYNLKVDTETLYLILSRKGKRANFYFLITPQMVPESAALEPVMKQCGSNNQLD